jgi:hypothetical protein
MRDCPNAAGAELKLRKLEIPEKKRDATRGCWRLLGCTVQATGQSATDNAINRREKKWLVTKTPRLLEPLIVPPHFCDKNGFVEREASRKTERYGNIMQVFAPVCLNGDCVRRSCGFQHDAPACRTRWQNRPQSRQVLVFSFFCNNL